MRIHKTLNGSRSTRPFLVLVMCALGCAVPAMGAALEAGDRIAICGDSITEQRLYTVYMEDYLLMCQPVPIASAQQFGWSGEALPGLLRRVGTDVLPFRPTVATTLYGMNDGGYKPTNPDTVSAFQRNTTAAIRALRAGGARLVLVGSPGAVDTDTFRGFFAAGCSSEAYNQTLLDLGQAAKSAAQAEGAVWVDVHSVMMDAMARAKARYGHEYALAADGVHPSPNGQLLMAYAFLRAMGCTGDIGTITVDAKTGIASATQGHRILAASPSRIEVESTRYPFCFTDDPASPVSTRSILGCVPFNEDLNRLRLVVTNAPARMSVTWGDESKVFSADELARGVSLSGEFLRNPFTDAFARVDAAVAAQQGYETPAVKSMLDGLASWRKFFPEMEPRYDEMQAEVVRKDLLLYEESRAAVRPVRHVIELRPASAP